MNFKTYILKSILYFSFGMLLLSACEEKEQSEVDCQKSPNDPFCIEEQTRQVEEQQAQAQVQAQEKAKFKSLGECLKAKKEQAGVSKPTVEMIQQCKKQ